MIHIEIIKSSDPLALGLYEFEFDNISIGRSKKNDLIFTDADIPLRYLALKIIQGQLIVQSLNPEPFFFINGKKMSGTLKLKPNDTIAFGGHQIQVIKSSTSSSLDDLSTAFLEFNNKSPELQFALHFIEEVLLDLEKDSNV